MAKLRVVVEELDRFIEDVMKKIALDVVANLAAPSSEGGTPIDTGWASANWIPYIGSPDRKTAGTRPAGGAKGTASRAEQESQSARLAASYKRGKDIVIANNVPYIVTLNEGSSAQAPSGFVQKAIFKAVKYTATA
jgi:hypothetical protein